MKNKPNIIFFLLLLLVLPNIVFLIFWYKWYISFPSLILIGYLISMLKIDYSSKPKNNSSGLLIITLLVSIFLATISGTCNLLPQTFDFIKHNLITCDLVKFNWPVVYDNSYYLSYNIAYYLVPGGLAKVFSESLAEYFIFSQLVVIIFVALRYVQQYVTKKPYHSFLIIILPNSIYLIRLLSIYIGYDSFFNLNSLSFFSPDYLFEKPLYLEISTFITQLVYVPQHFSALLISGCLLHYSWITNNLKLSILLCCFTPLWSVFVAASFLLLLFFQLIIQYREILSNWFFMLLSTIIFFIIVTYFNGHSRPGFKRFWHMDYIEIKEIALFIICIIIPYLCFLVLMLLSKKNDSITQIKRLINNKDPKIILPLICIGLVPFFLLFYQFDFMLRGCATFLFFLNLSILSNIDKLKPLYFYIFILVFSIGIVSQITFHRIYNIVAKSDRYVFKDYQYYLKHNKTIYDIDIYHQKGIKFQYISNSRKSTYYKYIAKKQPNKTSERFINQIQID